MNGKKSLCMFSDRRLDLRKIDVEVSGSMSTKTGFVDIAIDSGVAKKAN